MMVFLDTEFTDFVNTELLSLALVTLDGRGEVAAQEAYPELSLRGITRHHVLADAMALRAAYVAAKTGAAG